MILLQPRISEKSYMLSEQGNTYMFDVPTSANKLQIAAAIKDQYQVEVKSVRTAVAKGKVKTTPRRRRYPVIGKRKDIKRAYVTLMPGKTLPFFEDIS